MVLDLACELQDELSYVTRAAVNADKLLADPDKRQLVQDARMELKLPAEGPLTFKQKRELSYVTRAVVNADKLLADPDKQQLVKDARAALKLPAEGALTFKQKRELSYVTRAVVNADKLLADATKQQLVQDARAALKLPAEGALTFSQKRELSYWTRTSVSVPSRIGIVTQQRGARRVLEQQALRPTHTQMQFAMALMRISDNKHVKMAVFWKGRRVTLTEKPFIDITTQFLATNIALDINLSGGASKGDVASQAIVDGLCAMADIVPITAQVIGAAVFQSGHSYRVWTEMNSLAGHSVDETLPPLPVFDDRHSLDQVKFDAIETRLLTHFNVSVARLRPGAQHELGGSGSLRSS
jgi:hypothetical protein